VFGVAVCLCRATVAVIVFVSHRMKRYFTINNNNNRCHAC